MGVLDGLTPRGRAMRHLKTHRGLTERPAGSNTDDRPTEKDGRPGLRGIREAQHQCAGGSTWLVGTPWCGEWARWALQRAGVERLSSRQASVALIEQDARARTGPFMAWCSPDEWRRVLRGDLVVLFGQGVHVETVRAFTKRDGVRCVITEGGNTSSGSGGGSSQSNGGGSFRRVRPLTDVHGFARVNYPGGGARLVDKVRTRAAWSSEPVVRRAATESISDFMLLSALADSEEPAAVELRAEMRKGLFG